MEDTFQGNLTTRSLLKGILATEPVRPAVKHQSNQSALEYGRRSTSAYLDRTSSSPSMNLRSKMKDRLRRSLGKSAQESSAIKRKVEISSRIKQNSGKKTTLPILEDLEKITPRTLLKKIIQNEDEVSIVVSQKAKTAVDDEDDIQDTSSNTRLSSVGNVNLSLPDVQEKEHITIFRNFPKKRRINISDFEREVDERLPKNKDNTLEEKIEASSTSGSSFTMPRFLENKLDVSSMPQSTYKRGLLRRPNKIHLVSLDDFEQGVENKYRILKGSQECFIESITEDKADDSSNDVAQMDTALYAQPLLKEITTPNSEQKPKRKIRNGVSMNNESKGAWDIFESILSEETGDVIMNDEREEAEDSNVGHDREEAEDVIGSDESEEADNVIESEEREADDIGSNESEEAEDVIGSVEIEEVENVTKSKEREEADDIANDEREEAEDVTGSDESEEAENVIESNEREEADIVNDEREEVIASDESEEAENVIESEESEEAENVIESDEREADSIMKDELEEANVANDEWEEAEDIIVSSESEAENNDEREEAEDIFANDMEDAEEDYASKDRKEAGTDTMQNSRHKGSGQQIAQSINVAVLSVPGKEDTYDSSQNSTSDNLLAQSHIDYDDSSFKNKKKVNKQPIFTGPADTPPYIRNARFIVTNRPAAAKKIQRKKTVPAKKEGTAIPASLVKQIFAHHAQMRVNKDTSVEVEKCLERYLDQMSDDLTAYCAHAGRKTVTCNDVELLMKRQRLVTDTTSLNVLIEKHLPLDCRKLLIPCAMSGNKVFPKK